MSLKIFNTLSRLVEEFVPRDPNGKKVGMYCCGPTVHDFAHIGNFRTFVFVDLVRRYLAFKGFSVTHVLNVTDIEDKIIKRVRESRIPLAEYTKKYESAFFEDLQTLNCLRPHQSPRATEHIPEIISLIEKLVTRGMAYKASDGSVYFSIEKYRGCGCKYGQLVNLNFEGMRVGERISSDEYQKESVADFALWKARVPDDGEVFWTSPWGEGRPGWHIECSAMSMKWLGTSFDLHLGGEDLVFPHHEDEIAQSEGAGVQENGQPFVKYWMHGAHLLVEGKKMSKSLGNYFTLRDLQTKGFGGREIRYLLTTSHYREQFNFTMEGLQGARTRLTRIDACIQKLREGADSIENTPMTKLKFDFNQRLLSEFTEAMDDDFNVSAAWAAVSNWIGDINSNNWFKKHLPSSSGPAYTEALQLWSQINAVLGLGSRATQEIPADIEESLHLREEARKQKQFKMADAIRDELKAKGWVIEDTTKGARLKKLHP